MSDAIERAVSKAKETRKRASKGRASSAKSPAPDAPAASSPKPPADGLPEHYKKARKPSTASLIELQEAFIEALPGVDSMPGRGVDGLIRDHRNYVDDVIDPQTGKPVVHFRWGSDTVPGRREANLAKGFVPAYVKDRKLVPPNTPGAHPVQVAGATLLVRRREVAEAKIQAFERSQKARLKRISKTPEGFRGGAEITDYKVAAEVVGTKED